MNTEEYFQRIKILETDVAVLKLAVKELEREVAELKKAQQQKPCHTNPQGTSADLSFHRKRRDS